MKKFLLVFLAALCFGVAAPVANAESRIVVANLTISATDATSIGILFDLSSVTGSSDADTDTVANLIDVRVSAAANTGGAGRWSYDIGRVTDTVAGSSASADWVKLCYYSFSASTPDAFQWSWSLPESVGALLMSRDEREPLILPGLANSTTDLWGKDDLVLTSNRDIDDGTLLQTYWTTQQTTDQAATAGAARKAVPAQGDWLFRAVEDVTGGTCSVTVTATFLVEQKNFRRNAQ